ncbi:MAG: hypothetical protein JJT76_12040 [Clostridiaceae bacterium]|nr:hypothetical protein [Clostridiaceae bacterium]
MKLIHRTLLIVLLLTLSTTAVYAHRMVIEPIESGMIKVGYEDGSFSEGTNVIVYDSEGEEIFTGAVDEEGYFYYDADSDAARIVADDGMGHRVSWNVGDPISYGGGISKWLKVGGVILFFVILSCVFFVRNKKNSGKQVPV